jgi:hypothetical protein
VERGTGWLDASDADRFPKLRNVGKVMHEHGFAFICTDKRWEIVFHSASL